jgi:hypothetical protein
MRKLTAADITDLRAYERERASFRKHIIDLKRRRRIAIGDLMTIVFENTDTMRFQVQEMARAERMLDDDQIRHEVETYNELIPDDGELSGTLFIEIDDPLRLREWLPKLVGLEGAVRIELPGELFVRAYDPNASRLTREDITSTVHYLKFPFDDAARRSFVAGGPARVVVDHPSYQASTELTDAQRADLARDLSD